MGHLDLLLDSISALDDMASPVLATQGHTVPKAADLFLTNGGDINRAVIDIQKVVGHYVSDKWWIKNIGKTENNLSTAERFDNAYDRYIRQIADIDK